MCILCLKKASKAVSLCRAAITQQSAGSCAIPQSFRGLQYLEAGSSRLSSHSFSSLPAEAHPAGNENSKDGKVTHRDLLNPNVLKAQYAVRGELYNKAVELASQGKEIIYTNVGNPQQLGQTPITFPRQVLALLSAPFLLNHPKVKDLFPADAIARAKELNAAFGGAIGAYTDSRGSMAIREQVAKYIEERDGYPSNPDHIFLTDGASVSVRLILNAMLRDENDAILVPIPQYPLYSAAIQLYGGTLLPYNLKEEKGWGLDMDEIKQSVMDARARGVCVRAMVFINPGNPTGQCLTYDNLKELVKFAGDEGIVLLADEVYQPNIYQDEKPFIAAKKVLGDLGKPYADKVELASFHTVSKGQLGECGLRGGYVEFTNFHPGAIDEMYKLVSVNLSPNTVGQAMMSLMVKPPKEGDESYPQYKTEMDEGLASLRRRAHIMTDAFNALEGVTCNFTEGAMYSFPRLHLPPKAIAAAKAAGKTPDTFYCLELLKETGISTVPGSGFGQEEGTFHMRTTILPMEDKIAEFVEKFKNFHTKFMATYK